MLYLKVVHCFLKTMDKVSLLTHSVTSVEYFTNTMENKIFRIKLNRKI